MRHGGKNKPVGGEWSLANTLLLASALIVIGICVHLVNRTIHAPHTPSVSNGRLARQETVFKNLNVEYPVLPDEAATTKMRSYVSDRTDAFLHRIDDSSARDDALTVTYAILHYDSQTASVMFRQTQRLAKQTVLSQHILNYDLQNKKELQLVDVFKDKLAANIFVGQILHDYFQHHSSESFTSSQLAQLANINLENVHEFALTKDSLILYLDSRQSGLTKNVAISIKKELLSLVLSETSMGTRPSLVPSTEVAPTYSIDVMPPHEIVIDPNAKMLALTFDDGPGHLTPRLLDVLKAHGARATFFVIGRQVPTFPDTIRREAKEGNEIGNHSWNHMNFRRLSPEGLRQQINDTQRVIKEVTGGYVPTRMRPPEGAFNGMVADYAASQGLAVQLWNVDTRDWVNKDEQVVYERIMSSAADGRIILLHDIYPTSVSAASRAIPELIRQGYQLVTVSELDIYR